MYDYQAMCKVPYHHHSGARPLLSVRICRHTAPSGLGSGCFLLGHLQHLDVAQSPKDLSSRFLSSGGNVQTHDGRFLRQWWPLTVVSNLALCWHVGSH